jgi:hypothetical protein
MATKTFYATGAFRYGTRMLRAGDPVELDGPNARLFTHLGKISPNKPRAARPHSEAAAGPAPAPVQEPVATDDKTEVAPESAASPRKRAKRRARAKK